MSYVFDEFCKKANYRKMKLNSKTYLTLNFIKYNPYCTKKEVQKFIYGEEKYSSYSQFTWKNILEDNLVNKSKKGTKTVYYITTIGECYIDFINKNNYKN